MIKKLIHFFYKEPPRQTASATPPREENFNKISGLCCVFFFITTPLHAEITSQTCPKISEASSDDVFIQANILEYDDTTKQYHAFGHVDIYYEDKRLKADDIYYNPLTGLATAKGNVYLNDFQNNTQMSADFIELNKDFSVAVAQGIKILRNKHIRATAENIQRKGDKKTELNNISFTPCTFKPHKNEPLWSLTAEKVIDDETSEDITYKKASFNILGKPIATVPEFTYPRPNVQRRSGVLPPKFEIETNNGITLSAPYFYEIDKSRDVTLEPIFYSETAPLMKTDYRQKFDYGYLETQTAFTFSDFYNTQTNTQEDNKFRGSILSHGRFQETQQKTFGFDLNRVTDDTFLRRFDLNNPTYLQSRLFYNHSTDLSNFYIGSYAFQITDNMTDDDAIPFVLPYIDYEKQLDKQYFKGDIHIKSHASGIHRTQGLDTRRFINSAQWVRHFSMPLGIVMTFDNEVRGDLYHTSEGIDPSDKTHKIDNGFTGRFLPRSSSKFSLPLVKREKNAIHLIEPTMQFVVAPYGGKTENIPNEDGYISEFDASGLFDAQRFYGYDLVETGPRFNSGVRYMYHIPHEGGFETQFGQSYRLKSDSRFQPYTGLNGKKSDYVGRFVVNYKDYLHLTHRYRLNEDDLTLNMSDVTLDGGTENFRLMASHFNIKDYANNFLFQNAELLSITSRWSMNNNWHLMSGYRRDTQHHATLETRGGILYTDECLVTELSVGREYIRINDIQPATSVRFRIRLLATGNQYYNF